jgi:hypothetical protein
VLPINTFLIDHFELFGVSLRYRQQVGVLLPRRKAAQCDKRHDVVGIGEDLRRQAGLDSQRLRIDAVFAKEREQGTCTTHADNVGGRGTRVGGSGWWHSRAKKGRRGVLAVWHKLQAPACECKASGAATLVESPVATRRVGARKPIPGRPACE